MTVFAVLSTVPNVELGNQVSKAYPNNSYPLSPSIWFVIDGDVTTAQVCEKLGIGNGQTTNAVVVRISSYFGHATTALWEWLKLKGAPPT